MFMTRPWTNYEQIWNFFRERAAALTVFRLQQTDVSVISTIGIDLDLKTTKRVKGNTKIPFYPFCG